jgi:hypothetical protein
MDFAWAADFRRAIAVVFPLQLMNRTMPTIQPVNDKDLEPISSFLPVRDRLAGDSIVSWVSAVQ